MEENQGSVGSTDLSSAVESVTSAASSIPKEAPKPAETSQKSTSIPTAPVKPAAGTTPLPADPNAVVKPFTPDWKYKAGGKEHEIPEKFRGLCTDEATTEEVKKLFGQAATLDEFKTNNASLKKNLGEVGNQLNQYQSGVQQLRQIAQKGDWDTWFQKLNISPERIYKWVLDKVQYNQLPPEQKAQIDQQRELQRQAETAQEQVSQVSHREMQLATQMKGLQLEHTFGRADVKSMSDAFDARVGRPGAFKDAIIEHGKAMWALSNQTKDLSPDEAVADFVQRYGNPSAFATPNPAAGAATQGATTPQGANAQPPVKVIPNVAGRSTSPVKQKPKSVDDLKRLRDAAVKEDNASRSPSQGYLAG